MHVENETSDWRCGQRAIVHELCPVGVTVLSRIEPKGFQEIQRMFRAQTGPGKLKPQRFGFVRRRPTSGQRIVEIVEELELRLWRQRRMIGDIVGGTHEAIEGQDGTAPLLAQEP